MLFLWVLILHGHKPSIKPTMGLVRLRNHTLIPSWNQRVLSNEGKVFAQGNNWIILLGPCKSS